jgi:aldehyde dehydrogenase (NAD+)
MVAAFEAQRAFFESGATRGLPFRVRALKALREAILREEKKICAALEADLGKSEFEGCATETGPVLAEIDLALKRLGGWAKPRSVPVPWNQFPTRGAIHPAPKGLVLIVSPWNYPFQLAANPLVSAMAAGNCAIIKPSELAPATSSILAGMFRSCFPPEHVAVVEGDAGTSSVLLALPFDHIFFTGSSRVGRIVLEAAARNLVPVTLELGGKSPCIVCAGANLAHAAKRIAWGKFLNAGQSCVAPDHVYVHETAKDRFVRELGAALLGFYGPDPRRSPDYGRIVDDRQFQRLSAMLGDGRTLVGGGTDPASRYIAPTVLDEVREESPLLTEEIFGPILPVLPFRELSEVLGRIRGLPRPLALYVFSEDIPLARRVASEIPCGGACINDVVVQFANPHLPFGGIGASGMGACHGKSGFDTFSHFKAVARTPAAIDLPVKYPPYGKKLRWLKMFR